MSRSDSSRTVPLVIGAAVLLSALALGVTGVFGRTVVPPDRTPDPTVQPSTPPTAPPTKAPSDAPSKPPADGVFEVDLDNLTDHDVALRIVDETNALIGARTGRPGDGMSVGWSDARVENVDAETLRVVWVGLPRDETVYLGIAHVDGKVRLELLQQAPPPDSDSIGFDRIVELEFVTPVRASDVEVTIDQVQPA